MADVPTLDQFRADVLAFLEANAKPKAEQKKFVWGQGPDHTSLLREPDRDEEQTEIVEAKAWRAKRFDAGFGWITGPKAFGGRELPHAYDRVYSELESRFEVPNQAFFGIGLGMVAPTINEHAHPDVKAALLPKMFRGDLIGCQLFSEPGAGSDLAGLQCKAERDGDEWVINGQKVWTSGAHYSDVGEVVCRTDPNLPKHRGITGFVVDMHDPNIEVRPLRQMSGGAAFNEVFFNDYRVPDVNRLGEVNDGWRVALTTLMNERASIGSGGAGGGGNVSVNRLIEMVRHFGLVDDAVVRDELMRIYTGSMVARYSAQRMMDRVRAGQVPGPEMSASKLALTDNMRAISSFVSRVLGPRITADTGEWGTYSWTGYLLTVPAMSIAGGSDETLRNIVGERVLGLPKEPGIDTTSAFRDIPKGGSLTARPA